MAVGMLTRHIPRLPAVNVVAWGAWGTAVLVGMGVRAGAGVVSFVGAAALPLGCSNWMAGSGEIVTMSGPAFSSFGI
jgi:hypothetical protein